MRIPLVLTLQATLGLAAQTPAGPAVKWRGALWASAAASDQTTADGSMFLRSLDAGNGQMALDGLQLGADVALPDGWAFKFTLLAGQTARMLNAGTLGPDGSPAETGSLAWPEAQLVWTGAADTWKFGRMYTPMGMEVLDGTQDLTASRGLLFTYALPIAQLGLDWHHAFSPSWSTDLWVYNGEDRLQDNNQGKTAGLGLTYNHAGAADKFATLMAFSGPEQNGLGAAANTGAEGRKRQRLSLAGGWAWGKTTLLFEGDLAKEAFPAGTPKGAWSGAGLIGKYQFSDAWSAFARLETLKDDTGLRLGADPSIAAAQGTHLRAASGALGGERRWHTTFTRLEARFDRLNKDVSGGAAGANKPFSSAASLTWSAGTSF